MLDARFEGLGRPENLKLEVAAQAEYMANDTKFGGCFHTFVNSSESDVEKVLMRQSRHIRFLAERMLERLAEGDKTFVYMMHPNWPKSAAGPIARAFKPYGKSVVLFVHLQERDRPSGFVERLSDNVLFGYIDRTGIVESGWDISCGAWFKICAEARRLTNT